MADTLEQVHIVVNGEFYDFEEIRRGLIQKGHQFKSKSDSEILIHLYLEYGVGCLDHLRGEFAFVLWDARTRQLFCARDRYGVKPLFYTQFGGRLYIASEAKAFLGFGWCPEWDIHSTVHNGVIADPQMTLFRGVSKLRAGHYLTLSSSGTLSIRAYWQAEYPDRAITEHRSDAEMVEGIRTRLVDSVRTRMRADVPVGVYLSGGIDSSAVLGIAASILRESDPNAKLEAFTISFPEADGSFDESAVAERTAVHAGANFHKIVMATDDLCAALEDSVWHCEAPVIDLNGVAKFLLSRHVRDFGIRCVLTGEGSDGHTHAHAASCDYLS